MKSYNDAQRSGRNVEWINPIGGLGDTLMLTGVLKQVIERDPERRFNLVRRTAYTNLLEGHPAILRIGFPQRDDIIINTDYWNHETFNNKDSRIMQVLGRMFGLNEGVEERFYVQMVNNEDPLFDTIPWRDVNILISPYSTSPRKEWPHHKWELLTKNLRAHGWFVIQIGQSKDRYVKGAYSLLGLTTPKQVISLMQRITVVVTVDTFAMHAAHHFLRSAVVLWGPTPQKIAGYPEQIHLCSTQKYQEKCDCIGPGKNNEYASTCPLGEKHCLNQIHEAEVEDAVMRVIGNQIVDMKNDINKC